MKINYNGVVPNYSMKTNSLNRSEADKRIAALENGEDISAEYNAMDIGKNRFTTMFGVSTESKYGYAAEFDAVSRDYAQAISNRDYETAAGIDVISAMDEKYLTIKAGIDENYSGEEKELRLSELEKDYKFILDSNVISSTDLVLKNESAINKLRNTFAKAYENAKGSKSNEFLQFAYGSLANWSGKCDEIEEQLSSYRELFEQLKVAIKDSTSVEGAREYTSSLLKTITTGLAGVKEQNNQLAKGIQNNGSQEVKELWDLIEKKSQTYFLNNKTYSSDEEKYQDFLKNSTQISGIDRKLEDILKQIEE